MLRFLSILFMVVAGRITSPQKEHPYFPLVIENIRAWCGLVAIPWTAIIAITCSFAGKSIFVLILILGVCAITFGLSLLFACCEDIGVSKNDNLAAIQAFNMLDRYTSPLTAIFYFILLLGKIRSALGTPWRKSCADPPA